MKKMEILFFLGELFTLIIASVRPVCLTIESIWALSAHGLSLKNLSKNSICSVEKYFSSNRSKNKCHYSILLRIEKKTFDSKTNGMSEWTTDREKKKVSYH